MGFLSGKKEEEAPQFVVPANVAEAKAKRDEKAKKPKKKKGKRINPGINIIISY